VVALMPVMPTDFAEHLVNLQLLSAAQAQTISAQAAQANSTFVAKLIGSNLLAERTLAITIANYFGFAFVDIGALALDSQIMELLPINLQQQYTAVVIQHQHEQLTIAIADPTNLAGLNTLKFHFGASLQLVIAEYTKLRQLITNSQITKPILHNDEETIKNLDLILNEAMHKRASDIHFEPIATKLRIRYRIDSMLYEMRLLDLDLAVRICTRLKILANLNIAEKRLPQDGRLSFITLNQETRDCRISTCPTLFGEKIVVRILNTVNVIADLHHLGMEKIQQQIVEQYLQKPQGMILLTGPTGSGKTLTLYSMLTYINDDTKNIVTIEDPIEIQLEKTNQTEVNTKIGLSFATTLRSMLRQDPDVIMIGEIRDAETADIAIKAAQTGHLVLATLHTNSAHEAITRLQNMGIEAFNLRSSIKIIIAQCLVRKLCPHCKIKVGNYFAAAACPKCKLGYHGRTGIFEVLAFTEDQKITKPLPKKNFINLYDAGMLKVKRGITSLQEINRVIY
jgi:type IV pilus assembly protein PilB